MSIGLLLEFIAFQENSLTHHKNRVTNSNNITYTESLPVFSAVAQLVQQIVNRFPITVIISILLQQECGSQSGKARFKPRAGAVLAPA